VLETVYTALLVLVALAVVWFSGYVVLRLYRGQD
jgi:hypothetical protein